MTINILFFVLCFFVKNKALLFLLQSISSVFFALQYLCLKQWPAFTSAAAETMRVVLFYFYAKYGVKTLWQALTCVAAFIITLVITIVAWQAWYSILPLIGMTGIYVTLFSKHIYVVKIGLTITITCSTILLFVIGSYYSAVLEAITLVIGLVALIKEIITSSKNHKNLKTA